VTINAYPLQWPIGWKRTDAQRRREAKFGRARQGTGNTFVAGRALTITESVQRVLTELTRMAVDRQEIVISTNVPVRLDGLPRSGERQPNDPGAAVYWRDPFGGARDAAARVMAIDQYDRVEDNLAAIAATLDAMRAIERHGGALILERAFTGFAALPAPGAKRDWWEVLGVTRSSRREDVKAAYRRLASEHHPDKPGGSHDKMAELNASLEKALQECVA
jgi:hypothetical protein